MKSKNAFLALIVVQALHSIEEYVFQLWATFPPARFLTGLGHPAWSVMQGGYTPGLITSLMFLPLAVLLAKRLWSERATAT